MGCQGGEPRLLVAEKLGLKGDLGLASGALPLTDDVSSTKRVSMRHKRTTLSI